MMRIVAALLLLAGPAAALGGEKTLLLKTFEDPRYPAVAGNCPPFEVASTTPDGAPTTRKVTPNVVLGASVWSVQTRASRGDVINEEVKFLGTATGCGLMTSTTAFAPDQKFRILFELGTGTFVAEGTCDIVGTTDAGLLLAGCALKVAPSGDVVGGLATSASVFNPYKIPGFSTGSIWTLHLYTKDE